MQLPGTDPCVNTNTVYIFFVTARARSGSWVGRQCSRLVRIFSLSRFAHCMVGFNGWVLDPTSKENFYWELDEVLKTYPTLEVVIPVPVDYAIDLDFCAYGVNVPKSKWKPIRRWLQFGRGKRLEDCLCITLACLRAGGINVPIHTATPGGLFKWLTKQGYFYVRVADSQSRTLFRKLSQRGNIDCVNKY